MMQRYNRWRMVWREITLLTSYVDNLVAVDGAAVLADVQPNGHDGALVGGEAHGVDKQLVELFVSLALLLLIVIFQKKGVRVTEQPATKGLHPV